MNYIPTIVQYILLIFGIMNLVFGMLLIVSEQFFSFWSSRYWKHAGKSYETYNEFYYNKYIRGFFHSAVGVTIIYLVFWYF